MSRMLAARTPSTGGSETTSSNPDPKRPGRPKRTLIESACQQCRRRKSRVSLSLFAIEQETPMNPADTIFSAMVLEEGESRWSVLRRRNQMLETERADVRELFEYLQTRPDFEAQELFNRIRVGGYDEIFSILQQLRHGGSALGPSPATYSQLLQRPPSAGGETRLPPIQTMFDAARNSTTPSNGNMSLIQNGTAIAAGLRTSAPSAYVPIRHRQQPVSEATATRTNLPP
nr:hypothetical protein CFP56_21160 [Quercus suber]